MGRAKGSRGSGAVTRFNEGLRGLQGRRGEQRPLALSSSSHNSHFPFLSFSSVHLLTSHSPSYQELFLQSSLAVVSIPCLSAISPPMQGRRKGVYGTASRLEEYGANCCLQIL